jgi:hypothetical protein
MTKSEFNSFSMLEIENELLRKKIADANKRIESMQKTIDSLTDLISKKDENKRENVQSE